MRVSRARGLGPGLTVRRSDERGRVEQPWLDSRATFAFGTYDRVWNGLGALKVLNQDVIAPGGGFGLHPHWDMEIVTWVLAGTLVHEDTAGHRETLDAGDAQRLTAGTGLEHGERNGGGAPVHLFQLWFAPRTRGLAPGHQVRRGAADAPLALLVSPDGRDGSLAIDADVTVRGGWLAPDAEVATGGRAWLQVADGAVAVTTDLHLGAGDGVAIVERAVTPRALAPARVLLIELA